MFILKKALLIFVTYSILNFCQADIQNLPKNPCPEYFQYKVSGDDVHGIVKVKNDYTGVYDCSATMSISAILYDQNIKMTLLTPFEDLNKGADPEFKVIFPLKNITPWLTSLDYNGKVLCTGPPVPLGTGRTELVCSSYLKTNIIPEGSSKKTMQLNKAASNHPEYNNYNQSKGNNIQNK